MQLTVMQPFGGYAVGDVITDPFLIDDIFESEHAAYVVPTPTPPATESPAPATLEQ